MKPVRFLLHFYSMYKQLYSFENLLLAYRKASQGKRGHPNVASFEYHLEDNLLRLQNELKDKTYQPGEYHSFYVHDPKKRLISAAPFRDRVVHHALCNLIEPIFEKSFIFDSYANRVGKGTHKALDRTTKYARRYKYALIGDLRQFFPSVDHEILFNLLKRKIHDENTRWLIGKILQSGVGVLSEEYQMVYFPNDDLFAAHRPRGLPIGNLTSQFWANCYLNPFDHFIKKELGCRGYIRYVDDFLLFSNDKHDLKEWKMAIIKRLATLRMTVHEQRTQICPVTEGVPFLGFIVFPEHRRLKKRKGIAFQRKYKKLLIGYSSNTITRDQLNASVEGWVNHVRYADTWGLRRTILNVAY